MSIAIRVLSDLHFNTSHRDDVLHALAGGEDAQRVADLVIVAGDVDTAPKSIAWLTTLYAPTPVIFVAGNHEPRFIDMTLDDTNRLLKRDAAAARRDGHPVYVLEDETLTLTVRGHDVRLVGATLWTDFATAEDPESFMRGAAEWSNDHKFCQQRRMPVVRGAEPCELAPAGNLSPRETARRHHRSRHVIGRQLGYAREDARAGRHAGPTVVVTHHLPSLRSVPLTFRGHEHGPLFVSHADELLDAGAALWVHGHTHNAADYHAGSTRVVCNPLGRTTGTRENHDFEPGKLVHLACGEDGMWAA